MLEDKQRQERENYLLKKKVDHPFKIGDLVLLYLKEQKKGKTHKLSHPWKGPYRIVKFVSPVTVILEKLWKKKLRQPVHVSHLKFHHGPIDNIKDKKKVKKNTGKEEMEEDNDLIEYEVKEIVDFRPRKNNVKYKVVWKGFHEDESTWEPAENLTNSRELIEEFHRSRNLLCETCGYLAVTKKGLMGHVKKKHSGESLKGLQSQHSGVQTLNDEVDETPRVHSVLQTPTTGHLGINPGWQRTHRVPK
jgi:hypothetical protein